MIELVVLGFASRELAEEASSLGAAVRRDVADHDHASLRENVLDGVGIVASWLVVLGSTATAGAVCQPKIWRGEGRTRSACRAGTRTGD